MVFGDHGRYGHCDNLTGTQRLAIALPIWRAWAAICHWQRRAGSTAHDFGRYEQRHGGRQQPALRARYTSSNSEWAVTSYLTNTVFTWTFTNGPAQADMAR